MGVYIQRSCPNCHYRIEPYTRNYVAISSPIVECPQCKTSVRFSNRNEWELMTFFEKGTHFVATVFTGLIYAMIPVFIILVFELDLDEIATIAVSLISGELFAFYQLKGAILESKYRMKNSEYRKELSK